MKPLLTFSAAVLVVMACNDDITGLGPPSDPATEMFHPSLNITIPAMTKTASGVYYEDLVVGTGVTDSANTDSIYVDYAGYLKTGISFEADTNIRFLLGELIVGFKTGVYGMKEGGRRILVIPSELGYGSRVIKDANNQIKVPRQSTLVFDVTLNKVFNKAPATPASLRASNAGL